MMKHSSEGRVLRTWALAAVIGTCFSGTSFAALSAEPESPPAAASEPVAAVAPEEPPIDDSLAPLFTPDGRLAGGGYDKIGAAGGRRTVAGPKAPTPAQITALHELQREAESYERDAKDFRATITRIVKQHYEDRRKRVLAGLNREIEVEKTALTEARNEAIARLEQFVARYSGPRARPDATPDAMYRLAALYDEKARDTTAADITAGLRPAIALYKRIVREYPQYAEMAGVYYYLGHALADSNRLEEAQQVWRSLVCHNHYPYPVATDPNDPDRDRIGTLPQDHDPDYWVGWRHRYPTPESLTAPVKAKRAGRDAQPEPAAEEETRYRNPFPDTCEPVAQKSVAGEDPRYLAEIWWKIGDWYFDETDPNAGPYSLNRAVTAYQKAMQASSVEKGVLYGVAMYKLAWTYFKQQRYEAAVRQFVELLHYTDEVEKKTGDPGADFRAEAYTYIAGSLTYVDLAGPAEHEPFIPRPDVLDLEQDPRVVEQKMHVAIDRVQDPALIPQDRKWTVDVYRALAQEFKELNQLHNRVDISELVLKTWPMNREAPEIQAGVADTYDELARLSREGTAEHAYNSAKALEARSKLAAYVGNTPWVNAHRDDPEALQKAERLVRGGLQRAAAEHTVLARAYYQKANQTGNMAERRQALERTLEEYRLAETAWKSVLEQEANGPDAYESRFWLADARYWIVHTKVALGRTPSAGEILRARSSAVEVRDSNEDDKRLEAAAFYAVNLGFLVRDDQYRLHKESGGVRGLARRTEVMLEGEGKQAKVKQEPLPPAVRFLNLSQQEYFERVAPNQDVNKRAPLFRFQVADSYFLYGHFDEARKLFEPMYAEQCGKSEFGYKAWERLITMSNLERDSERSRVLAEAQKKNSCAVSEEQKTAEALLINPTLQELAYDDARKAFEKARGLKDGPDRTEMWRKAAALYRSALESAPGRDEAPEAAMNGAYAYKQVGEYDKAIAMYQLFIDRYGDEATLAKLQNGDPASKPPRDPSPDQYSQRLKYLQQAYDALSASYVLFFNYRKAAEEYDRISQIGRFEQAYRRDAAKNALTLYANMNDTARTEELRQRFSALGASPEQKAEADFIVAKAQMNEWDENGRDEGANRAARQRATAAMVRYYEANKNNRAADRFVVSAAYNVAKLHRASGGPLTTWYERTMEAFERYKRSAPVENGRSKALGSPEASMAAEANFALLDAEIRKQFDYDAGHHRYQGTTVEVIQDYRNDAREAERYHQRLQYVIDNYLAPEWALAARSRQGSLYDSLRTGLYNARPPALKLFSDKEEKLLQRLEQSENVEHQDRADQFRQNRNEAWRTARDKELQAADTVMVRRYLESVALARKYNLSNPAVDRAVERLAFFTEVLGDEKLREYAGSIEGFTYTDRMFLSTRPGITRQPVVEPLPRPLPVVPQ